MAEPKDEWYEDDTCMNCGEPDYRQSQVPGLCQECKEENEKPSDQV